MRIGSILENQESEKRIAITPDVVKKYTSLGIEVCLCENYGSHLGIKNEQYLELGAKMFKDEIEVLNSIGQVVKFNNYGILDGEQNLTVNMNDLPSGYYFVSIKTGNKLYNSRITVNN